MLKRIIICLTVFIFYIIWLPIALFKDIVLIFCIPFDNKRFIETYQLFMTNLYAMTNFHDNLNKNANDIGVTQHESTLYRQNDIGFDTNGFEEEMILEECE